MTTDTDMLARLLRAKGLPMPEEAPRASFTLFLGGLAAVAGERVLAGAVLRQFWLWFITPTFALSAPSLPVSIGLAIMASIPLALLIRPTDPTEHERKITPQWRGIITPAGHSIGLLVMLAEGWLLHGWALHRLAW